MRASSKFGFDLSKHHRVQRTSGFKEESKLPELLQTWVTSVMKSGFVLRFLGTSIDQNLEIQNAFKIRGEK